MVTESPSQIDLVAELTEIESALRSGSERVIEMLFPSSALLWLKEYI